MAKDIFEIFPGLEQSTNVVEFLNRSFFDELVEFDFNKDRYHNLFHVEGKYFVPLMDCTCHEIIQFAIDHMIHPDDRMAYYWLMDPDTLFERLENSDTPGILSEELRYRLLDGGWRQTLQVIVGGALHGLPRGLIRIYIYDMEEQEDNVGGADSGYSSEKKWDDLTGLLKQKAFFQTCERQMSKCAGWYLICADIENFKLFNDWYGREAGDILLARVGSLMNEAADHADGVAGYLGQDDYCLFAPFDGDGLQYLYEAIHQLIVERGTSVGFLPAFGVAVADGKTSILSLYDRAALASRLIKGDFHHRIRFYTPSMIEKTEEEYRTLSDFQNALANHEIFFCLQPQCRISTGRVMGAESLARWRKASGEMVPPDCFVPILEKYGFVTDLDQFIWRDVCKWIRSWMDRGHKPIPISVNVSQVDIFTINVPDTMEALMLEFDLPRDALKIEITESAYVSDTAKVKDAVQKLREMGFLVLMDDFGSGYSSLNMLRKLNVDVIKLDAHFLRLSDRDEKKGIRILETIVNMAKNMSLPIIVEGVENKEQVNFLEELGCSYIQGYHFYRPMEVAEFEKLIGDEQNVDLEGFSAIASQQFKIREFLDENVYSDNMLNNILGPVAFFQWDNGEDVNIIRYNDQFLQIVREPAHVSNQLDHVQQHLHPNDKAFFLETLKKAGEDRLNGASGLFGIFRADGSLAWLMIHFYFLEETEEGQVFYGSVRDMTEHTVLQNQMKLLARFSSESVVFFHRTQAEHPYQVVIYGLREQMGLSQEEFERELNEGLFPRRFAEEQRENLSSLTDIEILQRASQMRNCYQIHDAQGNPMSLYIRVDHVKDEYSDVEYILSFRMWPEYGG